MPPTQNKEIMVMQTQVMFYLLADEEPTETNSALYHACLQASHFYRQNSAGVLFTHRINKVPNKLMKCFGLLTATALYHIT